MIMPSEQRRAFTVTELLVVVAIIALLVALATIAFQKVRMMSRTSLCLSNQRQIALAQTNYATDNGGAFASPCTSFRGMSGAFNLASTCGNFPVLLNGGNLTNESYHSWVASYPGRDANGNQNLTGNSENEGALTGGRLFSYIGSLPVYRSPHDPTGRIRSYSLSAFVGVTLPNDVANYGKNWIDWFCGQGVTPRQWNTTQLARVKDPSSTMLSIVEEDGGAAGHNTHGFVIDPRPPTGSPPPSGISNPSLWALTGGWQGWIDTPAIWSPAPITTSNVDGSTESYTLENPALLAAMFESQSAGQTHGLIQGPDHSGEPWRRDWMHFRDRLLPGVIPGMVARYQQR